jgi:hypothetical protein
LYNYIILLSKGGKKINQSNRKSFLRKTAMDACMVEHVPIAWR